MKKDHWYEILCSKLGFSFLKIPLDKKTEENLKNKLTFCELKITPQQVISTSISLALIGIVLSVLLFLLNLQLHGLLTIGAFIGLAFFVFYYPELLTKYYRIKASSELVLSILYMIVSLRLVPNLERAIKFAAENLRGPVGKDLKRRLWDMQVGKYKNAEELLESFANKWKEENEEFYQTLDMIRTSMRERGEKREKTLDEAINVILQGNMERMKHYASGLRNPLTILVMFGVTLPVLTIVLFPILTIFLAEEVKPIMLVILYNIILPAAVYWLMNSTLLSLPLQFGIVDISLHPEAHPIGKYRFKVGKKKVEIPLLPISIVIGLILVLLGLRIASLGKEGVNLFKIGGGLLALWGIASALIFYSFFSYYKNFEIKNEIREVERQFDDAMFQLGHLLYTGQPIEKSLERLKMSTGKLSISKLFERILDNIRRFGYNFKRAIFDPRVGAAKFYPSYIIRNMLSIVADSVEKGIIETAKTMMAIGSYLKSVHSVEEYMKETLDETISDMSFMMNLLAPISCGIVVGLATVMVMVLYHLVSIIASITGLSSSITPLADASFLMGIVDIKKIVPAEAFLVIVGSYMLEVIVLLSNFLSILEYGGDPIEKHRLITKGVLFGMLIFTFCVLAIYFIFGSLIKLMWKP